jgi:hypothetical protein
MRIGGSKDIQTEIYTSNSEEVVGDARQRPQPEGSGRTSAVPPASRHDTINTYRHQKISAANRQLVSEVSSGLSSNRAFKVTFDTIVLVIDPTDSDTPGRMRAENVLFPLAQGRLNLFRRRKYGTHSDAFVWTSRPAHLAIIVVAWIFFGKYSALVQSSVRHAICKAA